MHWSVFAYALLTGGEKIIKIRWLFRSESENATNFSETIKPNKPRKGEKKKKPVDGVCFDRDSSYYICRKPVTDGRSTSAIIFSALITSTYRREVHTHHTINVIVLATVAFMMFTSLKQNRKVRHTFKKNI